MTDTRLTAQTDVIVLTGIEGVGHHGVFDFERRDGQTFRVDLVLGVDTRAAAATDDLADTVDYGGLVQQVKNAVETDPVNLIEAVAQRIADLCLHQELVQWVTVTVHKPEAPIQATLADVAVTITRSKRP